MSTWFKNIVLVMILISVLLPNVSSIGLESDKNGNYLTDRDGMPIYYFINDDPYSGVSNCYGACSSIWKPLEEQATAPLPPSLGLENFGSIFRADSKFQTTYKGRPLYTYSGDSNGLPSGNGRDDLWFLMRP